MGSELLELIADVREQVLYLQELGVENLDVPLRELEAASFVTGVTASKPPIMPLVISNIRSEISNSPETRPSGGSRLAQLPSLRNRPISALPRSGGADGAVSGSSSRQAGSSDVPGVPDGPPLRNGKDDTLFGDIAPALPDPVETIEQIRAEIGNCTRCPLYAGRKQIVHSHGSFQADLMFVGEAPGADEDEQGFPFVGRAGKLLTDIIEAIGFSRETVFIGNINRCRPPGNRAPVPAETETCRPYLLREIAVVRPKVIVVLGNTAMHNLLDIKTPISKLRGNFQDYFGVKVMPTFHPAYLLRDPHKKREVWEDMKMVRDYLNS